MAIFDDGVTEYETVYAEVKVRFPIKRGVVLTKCTFCPYLSANNRMCQLNKATVFFPESEVGPCCPLKAKEETKDV